MSPGSYLPVSSKFLRVPIYLYLFLRIPVNLYPLIFFGFLFTGPGSYLPVSSKFLRVPE